MGYNYSKLDGRITEKFGTRYKFAEAMKMSERTLSLKMNGKIAFKQPEISIACELLEISLLEMPEYFFKLKTQSN